MYPTKILSFYKMPQSKSILIMHTEKETGESLAKKRNLFQSDQAISISVNGILRDFFDQFNQTDTVQIFSFEDEEGKKVFWHSSAHVLAQAVTRLWPNALPTIGPPITSGFYYDFDNLSLTPEDFPKIEEEVKKIAQANYQPQKITFQTKEEALRFFQNNPYKIEIIHDLPNDMPVTGYQQGEFVDLCKGPHISHLNKIESFKILKTSSAYWKGYPQNKLLTRIYGISFPKEVLMKEYLNFLEEVKKRDHKVLGSQLNLFFFAEEAPGMPFIQPNGMYIWDQILQFWRELHHQQFYQEIKTPIMLDQSVWEKSGHWENYHSNMYTCRVDHRTYAIKPMNCPGAMLTFLSKKHSYRDLPLRLTEIGLVHRNELSGSLTGLFRVRAFHQDDAHIFVKEEDIKEEILKILHLCEKIYAPFNLRHHIELSTKPEKNAVGTKEDWDLSTDILQQTLLEYGRPYTINQGDGAFYGPKIDIHIEDNLHRTWQSATIQLDQSMPKKFKLTYADKDQSIKIPWVIHRALFGSFERFLAIIIENYCGKFPLWLNPMSIRIFCVADRHESKALEIQREIEKLSIPVQIDNSSKSMAKKIRFAQMDKVNYMIIIGDTEVSHSTISLRSRDSKQQKTLSLQEFLDGISQEYMNRSLSSYF